MKLLDDMPVNDAIGNYNMVSPLRITLRLNSREIVERCTPNNLAI